MGIRLGKNQAFPYLEAENVIYRTVVTGANSDVGVKLSRLYFCARGKERAILS